MRPVSNAKPIFMDFSRRCGRSMISIQHQQPAFVPISRSMSYAKIKAAGRLRLRSSETCRWGIVADPDQGCLFIDHDHEGHLLALSQRRAILVNTVVTQNHKTKQEATTKSTREKAYLLCHHQQIDANPWVWKREVNRLVRVKVSCMHAGSSQSVIRQVDDDDEPRAESLTGFRNVLVFSWWAVASVLAKASNLHHWHVYSDAESAVAWMD